jgi:hypothetical protein
MIDDAVKEASCQMRLVESLPVPQLSLADHESSDGSSDFAYVSQSCDLISLNASLSVLLATFLPGFEAGRRSPTMIGRWCEREISCWSLRYITRPRDWVLQSHKQHNFKNPRGKREVENLEKGTARRTATVIAFISSKSGHNLYFKPGSVLLPDPDLFHDM